MLANPPSVASIEGLRRRRARGGGFTLAEMAVIVAIAGLLALAMIPDYLRSAYRARRTEALYALHSIHDFESVHYATNGEYTSSFPALGFALDGGSQMNDGAYSGPRYTYTLATWELGGQGNANYRATATADLDPDDATLDIVIIENALTVLE